MYTSEDFASLEFWELALSEACWGVPQMAPGGALERAEHRRNEESSLLAELRSPCCGLSPDTVHRRLFTSTSLKKWRLPVDGVGDLKEKAVKGFIQRNGTVSPSSAIHWFTLRKMRELLDRWLPPTEALPLPRLGPGAVAEKYTWAQKRMLLERVAEASMSCLPTLSGDPITDHDRARLCAVPKQWDKDRLITVEPYINTLLQQRARAYVFQCLSAGPLARSRFWRRFWDVAPLVQRDRALLGSVTNACATIDLSDASDGISYDLVASVFPAHILAELDLSRTPYFVTDQGSYELKIYAGMGNATTFLVETLVFLAYCTATAYRYGFRPQCTVFGDDIVCGDELARSGRLENEGSFFRVNRAKSFWGGSPFRESCGVYAYKGVDVTVPKAKGFRLDRPEELLALSQYMRDLRATRTVVTRNLHRILAGYHPLPNLRWLPENTIGMCEPCLRAFEHQDIRWNRHYQRLEVRCRQIAARTKVLDVDRQAGLDGWFIGAIRTERISTRKRGPFYGVKVPLKGFDYRDRWLPASGTYGC